MEEVLVLVLLVGAWEILPVVEGNVAVAVDVIVVGEIETGAVVVVVDVFVAKVVPTR